jgi:hypothetical protein
MKKALVLSSILSVCIFATSCSKEEVRNQPPSAVQLVFPTQDLLCITNNVLFDWSDSVDEEGDVFEYNILVAKDRQLLDVVENRKVYTSNISIVLEKATAYYWQVNTVDVLNEQESSSPLFAFYTTGDGLVNYAPFMADLKAPENNTSVNSGNIDLVWEGTDANTSDSLTYELFFGENDALNLVDNALSVTNYPVSVTSGKTYSWKVNVKDDSGSKSIGQTFTFSVN